MVYDEVLRAVRAPVKISFEPTMSCNLRCPMCDRTHKSDYEKHRDGKLPYETVKRFLQDAGRLGTRNFLFIGGGEPLAEPHLPEYMQILNDSGVSVHLWTNGTLINEENAPLIARYCDMVTVSLDSPDPAVNDICRGVPGATERCIAGLRLLRENSSSLYLRIHSVISTLNIDHLRDFADFAAENDLNEIGGALIAPFEFIPENMRFSEEQVGMISNRIEDLCEYARKKRVPFACNYANMSAKIIRNLQNIHNMYSAPGRDDSFGHITCLNLWGQLVVRPNGDVSVCCFSYKPILGNLHDNTLEEIWHSERAEELRELVKSGKYIDSPCLGCDSGHPVFTRDLALTGSLRSFQEMCLTAR